MSQIEDFFTKRDLVRLSSKIDVDFLSGYEDKVERLFAILESSFDGIYITDGEANTIWCNHSYEVITGLTKEIVVGKNMHELVKDNIMSSSCTLLALEKKGVSTIEQSFTTGRHAVVTSTPIFDEANNIIMVVTNVRDMSELINIKAELELNKKINQQYQTEIDLMRKQIGQEQGLIANDEKMIDTLFVIKKVASKDTTVLLLGETGVGKERIANFIHNNSERKDFSFIKVNCSTIVESLAESELFGYEKGSFTGANKEGKPGLFEVADRGTIFLDEVGELPLRIQAKLLRVLQEQEVIRVGGNIPIKVNVRILAATNRNLQELVKVGTFREDLYYRLSVFPVTIPPLRERRKDIAMLGEDMLNSLNKKYNTNKALSLNSVAILENYCWPGNVRELRNIIERAFIMNDSDIIHSNTLGIYEEIKTLYNGLKDEENFDLKLYLEKIEYEYLKIASKNSATVRGAARSLNMDPATYLRKKKNFEEKYILK